ncbi:MAG: hypothetical protein V4649_06690 [Bacteroidota bacterium]
MKRNKKNQSRGYHLNGKTNQYVHRKEMGIDELNTSQHPLGTAENVLKYEQAEEDRVGRK